RYDASRSHRREIAEDGAGETGVLRPRGAQLARRLDPVGAERQHHAARAHGVDAGLVHAGRRLAPIAQRLGRVDQALAPPNDHRVARAEMLARAVVDRAHALGDGLVLEVNAPDAGVADGLLRLAVDQIVVAVVGHTAEAAVPVRGVRQRLRRPHDLTPGGARR